MPRSDQRPNFFILGAPKCGTTSLARWLEAHPAVFFSPHKEPHFYSTDLANRNITSEAAYHRLFDGAGPGHLAIGEASTWYLFSKEAVPNILQAVPDARFIVMTRDPVDMARSLHHHNLRVLHEDEADFARAWALQDTRRAGHKIPRDCTELAFLQYGAACSLGAQVARLLDHVPPEQVLHIPLDGLRAEPALHYRRALAFLRVPDDGREDFPLANPARGHRSRVVQRALRLGSRMRRILGLRRGTGLARLNERADPKPSLDLELVKELERYFQTDLGLLRMRLGELTIPQNE